MAVCQYTGATLEVQTLGRSESRNLLINKQASRIPSFGERL